MTTVGENKKTNNKRAGDAMIGIGTVLAIICLVLGIVFAGSGGNALMISGTIPAMMLVMIGYLKRIAVAIEQK